MNPARHAQLAADWQQDRVTTGPGGAQGLVTAFSRDRGRHWHRVVLPGVSRCSGGSYQLASDPWLSFSADGRTLYAASLVFNADNPVNGVVVSTSHNGGKTWARPVTVIRDTKAAYVDDKQAVTADPRHPDSAYVVWDRQELNRHGGQPVYFAKTTNGGRSWSAPRNIYDPTAQGGSTEGNIITVLPGGTLVDVFLFAAIGLIPPERPGPGPAPAGVAGAETAHRAVPTEIRAIISHNRGRTWSSPVVVARIGYRDHGFDPDTGTQIRNGGNIPAVATDPRTGRLYVTWAGARLSSSDQRSGSSPPPTKAGTGHGHCGSAKPPTPSPTATGRPSPPTSA